MCLLYIIHEGCYSTKIWEILTENTIFANEEYGTLEMHKVLPKLHFLKCTVTNYSINEKSRGEFFFPD